MQEAIKESGSAPDGECPKNEYGPHTFLVCVNRPANYAAGEGMPGIVPSRGTTVFVWDRRRSLFIRNGPGDSAVAIARGEAPIPVHKAGHEMLCGMVRMLGIQQQVLYLWAKRVGDCLELE